MIETIIAVPNLGFANRLKFMASVDTLSRKLKSKRILVLWETGAECRIPHEVIFEKINNFEFIDVLPERDEYITFGHIHLENVSQKLKEEKSDRTTLVVMGGHEYKHPSDSHLEHIKQKCKFYNSIIWSDAVKQQLKTYVETPTIGIHYRHSIKTHDEADIASNPLINFAVNSPFSEFEKFIKKCKHKCFFISNSQYHKNYINENFSKKVKVINLDENNDRASEDSMFLSIIEFILLTKSDMIVGSYYSSFSDEASYFNIIPKIMPMNPFVFEKKETIDNFTERYHTSVKPTYIDQYFVLNSNIKSIVNTF